MSEVEENVEENAPVICPVDPKGNFIILDQIALNRAAQMCIKTQLAPPHLVDQGGVAAVAAALLMCKQFNLPQKAMGQMSFIKGRLTVYGSLYTALAQRHSQYGEHEIFFVDNNIEKICVENKNLKEEAWACVIRVKRKDSSIWNEYFFSLDDAAVAGLTANLKPSSPWRKYIKDMLYHKCKYRAFSKEYASVLEGIDYHEDVIESLEGFKDVTPRDGGTAQLINEDLG